MTTPIGFGPFRPLGDRSTEQASAAGPAAPATGVLAGRAVRRTETEALAGPAAPALAALRQMAAAAGPAEPARALAARSVALAPATAGERGAPAPAAPEARVAGSRVLTLMRSASAAADGVLFRQVAEKAGIDPALMTQARREAVDALVGGVPLPPWSPMVAGAVLADALAAALAAAPQARGSPAAESIEVLVAEGAARRARAAVAAGDGNAAAWVADAVARRLLLDGGGDPGAEAGIGGLVEAVLSPPKGRGEIEGVSGRDGKMSMLHVERVGEEVGRFVRHFGKPA